MKKKGRQVRQAATKAASKQREILLGDGGSEDEEREEEEEEDDSDVYTGGTNSIMSESNYFKNIDIRTLANREIPDILYFPHLLIEDSGSDEDFMVEDDDDDSDYGRPKRKISKVSRRSKDKKSPKPKLRASGKATHKSYYQIMSAKKGLL